MPIDGFDFDRPLGTLAALRATIAALRRDGQMGSHPRSFGFFEQAPTAISVVGSALAAAFNPQLALERSAPFAVAAERKLARELGGMNEFHAAAKQSDTGVITSTLGKWNRARLHILEARARSCAVALIFYAPHRLK